MKILIDMNLSPDWVSSFKSAGIESIHWSHVGKPDATDTEIIEYARHQGYIVFTHDLDFGAILALTQTENPSVIQVRTQDVLPDKLADRLIALMLQHETTLNEGALIVIDEIRSRIRILTLRKS